MTGLFSLPGYSAEQDIKKFNLVICAIFQNEEFYLQEWIEFHKLVGVEHFYLYNNLSTDNSLKILQPYIEEGSVDLIDWSIETHNQQEYLALLQVPAYKDALKIVKETSQWAAFIDLDEFIVPIQHKTLTEFLKKYEDFGGLAINWQIFGTSGLNTLPHQGLIIENLVWKAPSDRNQNEYIKYIVRPECVETVYDPHHFTFLEGYCAVNSSMQPLKNGQRGQQVIIDQIQINHYWFGTQDWFRQVKIPRREKWGMHVPKEQLKELISAYNVVEDEAAFKYIAELKNMLFHQ